MNQIGKENFHNHSVNLILDSSPNQKGHNKENDNYRPISLMNEDTKILHKVLANEIQQQMIKIINHDQDSFFLGDAGLFQCTQIIKCHTAY